MLGNVSVLETPSLYFSLNVSYLAFCNAGQPTSQLTCLTTVPKHTEILL